MPRLCAVCIAPGRAAFEVAVFDAGLTVKDAARAAGLPYPAAKRHVRGHPRATENTEPGGVLDTFSKAFEHTPMAWQKRMLVETRDTLLVKSRQCGATESASALAVHVALTRPGSTSAIISPSQRQSSEVTFRARHAFWRLGETLRQDSATLLRTANGSRVISLPGSARGIRGYAADLVVLDEASWISPETFVAARPLTAATNGRLIVQSTPGAPVGPFYEMVREPPEAWAFLKVRGDEAPIISKEFLERERREMEPDLYRQEYMAEFGSSVGGLLSMADIDSMFEEAG